MATATSDGNGNSSREKLLIGAERLFAESGFQGVSVRNIADAVGVNSALVGYYFGGKQGLLAEVYTRHCTPLNLERTRLLKALEDTGGMTLEGVLEAFLRPSLQVTTDAHGRSNFTRLRAVLSGENSALLEELISTNFDRSTQIFVDALSRCLPHLTREDVLWRFHFLLGAIYYTGMGPHRIYALSNGVCDPSDPIAAAEEMIPFLVAGFRAPRSARGASPQASASHPEAASPRRKRANKR